RLPRERDLAAERVLAAAPSPGEVTGSGRRRGGLECQWLAIERVQGALERHSDAREAGRVPDGVPGRLGAAQALDEVEERADVVGVERDDELLVVQAEGVGRVVVDARVLAPDLDVLAHDA